MIRTNIILIFIFLISLFSCSAPSTNMDPDSGRTVIDGLGRSVRVAARVERIVSLAPSITEMIFAAGAGGKLVGVTTYCDYPEPAKAIQKVGDTQTPNIETILALKPQIVFVSTDSQLESFADTLGRQNVAVFVLDIKRLEDVSERLKELGHILGTYKEAEQAASRIEERIKAVAGRPRLSEPARTFVQISREPFFTIGRESFLTELIRLAGGVSVTENIPTAYPKLNKETALAMKPSVIILSDSEDNRDPNDSLRESPAIKNGRVYRINADIISRPGPRLADALEQIADFLRVAANN